MGARRIFVDGVAGVTGVLGDVGDTARDLSRPRRRAPAREPDRRPRGRSERTRTATADGAARRIDCRHGHPAADGRGDPRHRAIDRDRQVARTRFPDGAALVPDRRWPRDRGVPPGAGASPGSRDEAAAFDPTTRVTTGTPGLDPLVNGGYFLGSTTVVSGISGVGKSVMGLQYLAEGAGAANEASCSRSTSRWPQVIRNANSIGIDLQAISTAASSRSAVRLTAGNGDRLPLPRRSSRSSRTFKPKRVLFDSLSTYGSNLGTAGRMFRDFFHALVALMKEHQTATVYNHENPEMLGMASMMGDFAMSSLVDNILLMNWIELGDAFRLGLTVAKMRANRQHPFDARVRDSRRSGPARAAADDSAGRAPAVLQLSEPDLAQPGAAAEPRAGRRMTS